MSTQLHRTRTSHPHQINFDFPHGLHKILVDEWHFVSQIGQNIYFGAFTLILLEAKVLVGSWGNWDLPVWDNAHYYEKGYFFAHLGQLPKDIDWSPAFSLYYSIFHSLLSSTASPLLIYIAHKTVSIFLVLIIGYIFLRLLFNPLISWLICSYLIILSFGAVNLHVVHYFVLAAIMGFAIIASSSNKVYMNLIMALLTIITALIRPEFTLAIPLWCALSTAYDFYNGKFRTVSYLYKVVYFVCILFLGIVIPAFALSKDTGRSWLAFGQHYALGYSQRHPEWGKEPFANWEEPIRLAFGDADSVGEALKSNSGAVIEHLLWNIRGFIREFNVTLDTFPVMGRRLNGLYILGVILAFSIFAGVFLILQGQKIRFQSQIFKKYSKMFLFITVLLLITLFSVLMIYPLNKFLIQLLPVYFIVLGGLASIIFQALPHRMNYNGLLPLLLMIGIVILPTPYKILNAQPVSDITQTIAQIPAKVSFMLSGRGRGLCIYSNIYKCKYYNLIGSDTPLSEIIQTHNIMVLVINEDQRRVLRDAQRQELADLEASPQEFGWCFIRSNSIYKLYIRQDFYAAHNLLRVAGCVE